MTKPDIDTANADTPEALTRIFPDQRYGMLDDGMGNLALVRADAWAAAYYYANHP